MTGTSENVVFLTTKQAAEITGEAPRTLDHRRYLGVGIPYVKFGRSVRYRLRDILAYADANTKDTTATG